MLAARRPLWPLLSAKACPLGQAADVAISFSAFALEDKASGPEGGHRRSQKFKRTARIGHKTPSASCIFRSHRLAGTASI
jgi:hypothetical protein